MNTSAGQPAQALVHVNGQLLPRAEATISVFDRGFLFADSVYEVIPVYQGAAFRLREHLARLDRSLGELAIPNPHSNNEWSELIRELAEANGGGDLSVYLQVTRGAPEWREHWRDAPTQCTVVAFTGGLHPQPASLAEHGVRTILRDDPRWRRCDIKATALLPNVLARREAAAADAFEAIFVRDGYVTEGAAANVFIVSDGLVSTPPLDNSLLPGVTRDAVLDFLRQTGHECVQRPVSRDALLEADEVWLTSSTREILPVTWIDDHPIGAGRPGPVWADAQPGFSNWVREQTGWLPLTDPAQMDRP